MQKIGKEVKIGIAVVGVLTVCFVYVLIKKISNSGDQSPTADQTAATTTTAAPTPKPAKPTVIAATDGDRVASLPDEAKRNRWSLGGGRTVGDDDGKAADPAADKRSLFAPSAREQGAPDSGAGSIFGRQGNLDAPNRFPDNAVRKDIRDESTRDARSLDGAVQASDSAPIAGSNDSDKAGSGSASSIFSKGIKSLDKQDQAAADGKSSGAEKGADPFQRRSTDAAPPSDPFNRRPAADAAPANDPFVRKSIDAAKDAGEFGKKSTDERADASANGLAPVDGSASKWASRNDAQPDRNPLRRLDNDPAPNGGALADSSRRFSSDDRPNTLNSTPAGLTLPSRDSSSVAPAARIDGGTGAAAQPLTPDDAAKPGQYTVEPNDNYWTISQKVYGDGSYFKAIYQHNSRQHPKPERLQVGEVLQVPDVATLQKLYPDLCPKPGHAATTSQRMTPASARIRPGTKVYVVEEGDTLYRIAKEQLGNPSKFGQIYQLNRDVLRDIDYLKPGTELLIPTGESRPDTVARQPGGPVNQ